jgi:hypothetical protein
MVKAAKWATYSYSYKANASGPWDAAHSQKQDLSSERTRGFVHTADWDVAMGIRHLRGSWFAEGLTAAAARVLS